MPTHDEINYVATDLRKVLDSEINTLPAYERVMIPADLAPHLAALMATKAIDSLDHYRSHNQPKGA